MLNKLKKARDTLSEKTKLLIYVLVAGAVFLTSCFMPLAFRGDGLADPSFTTGERAAMFVKYNAKDSSIRYKVINDPEKDQLKFCEERFNEIAGSCILDTASRKMLTEGQTFIYLTDGDKSMTLCRMWLQDKGDWTNWIEIYMDAESGFIYYLYVSSTCVSNNDSYASAIEEELNAKILASLLAKESGYDLKVVNWSGKTEDSATAYTSLDGSALVWEIYCSYYPSAILDVKISVA